MELRHLRYFIAVAEEENVSRAAVKLHVSQPALSRQVRDLEEELGFPLLERTAKSVKLTEAGRAFLQEARDVVRHAQEAVKRTKAIAAGERGEIHVGYAPSLTIEILPRTLRLFQSRFPKVRVSLHDLSTEEMLDRLGKGKLDVALVVEPPAAMLRGLKFKALGRYPICLAVAPRHPLVQRRTATLAEAVKQPVIAYNLTDYPEYRTFLDRLSVLAKARPRIAEEHDGVTSLVTAVESGRGVALVPSCLAAMTGARLKLLPFKPSVGEVVVGAAWKKEIRGTAAEQFIAAAAV
jgi:DNA-binding transcriptional LysR family regulator